MNFLYLRMRPNTMPKNVSRIMKIVHGEHEKKIAMYFESDSLRSFFFIFLFYRLFKVSLVMVVIISVQLFLSLCSRQLFAEKYLQTNSYIIRICLMAKLKFGDFLYATMSCQRKQILAGKCNKLSQNCQKLKLFSRSLIPTYFVVFYEGKGFQ